MHSTDLARRLDAAIAIGRDAGALARDYFGRRATLTVETKGIQDWVSVADRAVEELIRRRLAETFPEDGFLGEESGGSGGAGAVWVVDPIDGTSMFLRGIAYFCISIALVVEGELELGVIYDPMADELFAGRRGHGAACNGRPMRVSAVSRLRDTVMGIGFSNRRPTGPVADWLKALLAADGSFRQLGAGALMLAHVADGRLDGYYEWHHNSWDALAGLLLCREAGAFTNDFLGDDGLTEGNVVLACGPDIRLPLETLISGAGLPLGTAYLRPVPKS